MSVEDLVAQNKRLVARVIELEQSQNVVSERLEQLGNKLLEVVDWAKSRGMTAAEVVGMIECIKHSLIQDQNEHYQVSGGIDLQWPSDLLEDIKSKEVDPLVINKIPVYAEVQP